MIQYSKWTDREQNRNFLFLFAKNIGGQTTKKKKRKEKFLFWFRRSDSGGGDAEHYHAIGAYDEGWRYHVLGALIGLMFEQSSTKGYYKFTKRYFV